MKTASLFILALAFLGVTALVAVGCRMDSPPTTRSAPSSHTFTGQVYDASGKLIKPTRLSKVHKSDEEWSKQLSRDEFYVVRRAGTERPFTGAMLENKKDGVYTCVACKLPLFSSDSKFKSGTGWPSFYEPIAKGNVDEEVDRTLGMTRTEILCARCDGHLGHVFNDGPRPTGLRYCVNSVSLSFTPIEDVKTLAEPTMTDGSKESMSDSGVASAVFAGGCFWCVEAVFEELDGVQNAISGYAGGSAENANYQAVSSGRTKHAEAVQIVYDPSRISYEELLRVHFATHDPTQLNRQGNDVGPHYRSTIFYANDQEQALAGAFIDDLNDQKVFPRPVVTTLEPLTEFYPAEAYHQNYVCQNPSSGYVRGVALPKVAKVRKEFKDKLKDESPLEKAGR